MEDRILQARVEANRLGALNTEVIGYTEASSFSQALDFILITRTPEFSAASEIAWYDRIGTRG